MNGTISMMIAHPDLAPFERSPRRKTSMVARTHSTRKIATTTTMRIRPNTLLDGTRAALGRSHPAGMKTTAAGASPLTRRRRR